MNDSKKSHKRQNRITACHATEFNEISKVDMALMQIGIFGVIKDSSARSIVKFEKKKWRNHEIEATGPLLSDWDMMVFAAILNIFQRAHFERCEVVIKKGADVAELIDINSVENAALQSDVMQFEISYGMIKEALGLKGDSSALHKRIRDSLDWLSMYLIKETNVESQNKEWKNSRMIWASRGDNNRFVVTISFRLTAVLLGLNGYRSFAALDLVALRALPSGIPRLLYLYLSGLFGAEVTEHGGARQLITPTGLRIRNGEYKTILLNTLVKRIYRLTDEQFDKLDPAKRKEMRRQIKNALAVTTGGSWSDSRCEFISIAGVKENKEKVFIGRQLRKWSQYSEEHYFKEGYEHNNNKGKYLCATDIHLGNQGFKKGEYP